MSREKRKFDQFPFAVREPEREETMRNNVKRIKGIKLIKKKKRINKRTNRDQRREKERGEKLKGFVDIVREDVRLLNDR